MSLGEEALLRQIQEAPDDDAVRLVYADALLARGDPLGEFIQLQCRLDSEADPAARQRLELAKKALLREHEEAWTGALKALLDSLTEEGDLKKPQLKFVRGFVEEVSVGAGAVGALPQLFAAAPMLRRLTLLPGVIGRNQSGRLVPRSAEGLFEGPLLGRLEALHVLIPGLGNAGALALAQSPHLARLSTLTVRVSILERVVASLYDPLAQLELTDVGAVALARSPHLRALTSLDLSHNAIERSGVVAIAQAPWALEHLELGHNPVEATALATLAQAAPLAGLKRLGLAGAMGAGAWPALAGSRMLRALQSLDLERCQLGPSGLTDFLEALRLPSLRHLRLDRNQLGDAGAIALASHPKAAQLTSLELRHNRIGPKGAQALASSKHLARLESLVVDEPSWKPDIAELFAASKTLARAKISVKGRPVAR